MGPVIVAGNVAAIYNRMRWKARENNQDVKTEAVLTYKSNLR